MVMLKHRKNCECCPGHSLTVSQLSKSLYLSIGLVFCCFGQFEKLSIEFDIYFFPQAFEANASSSGGRQSVNDKELSITVTKSQKKKKVKVKRYKKKIGVLPNFPNV